MSDLKSIFGGIAENGNAKVGAPERYRLFLPALIGKFRRLVVPKKMRPGERTA
jgi:hypothetical protein